MYYFWQHSVKCALFNVWSSSKWNSYLLKWLYLNTICYTHIQSLIKIYYFYGIFRITYGLFETNNVGTCDIQLKCECWQSICHTLVEWVPFDFSLHSNSKQITRLVVWSPIKNILFKNHIRYECRNKRIVHNLFNWGRMKWDLLFDSIQLKVMKNFMKKTKIIVERAMDRFTLFWYKQTHENICFAMK